MKLIFLNAWNGKIKGPISDYISERAPTTDIFCFQEAPDEMITICEPLLADFEPYQVRKFISEYEDFSQLTYVRKNIKVDHSGSVMAREKNCGLGLFVQFELEGKQWFVCNVHGIAHPGDKLDNPARIAQSKSLISQFTGKQRVIIGGDFNLYPETESVGIFKKHGYRDLIEECDIKNTRNRLVWEMYPENKQYFSDYVFMTPAVRLEHFGVVENEISDHLPLELTCS